MNLHACSDSQDSELRMAVRSVAADNPRITNKVIFAAAQPDGQYCFYESPLPPSSSPSKNLAPYLEENCELLTPSSIHRLDLASAVNNNSRWANIRTNFAMTPLVSSAACLASMLLLVRFSTTVRALLCTGSIASILGFYVAGRELRKESFRKTKKVLSDHNYMFSDADYEHLRKTFTVLQSSNSSPCPRKPDLTSAASSKSKSQGR